MATKFLDYTGLSYLWNKIKTYAGNFACTAAKALGIHFVIPNETEQTATLTATITGVTSYFVGLTVALRMPFNTPASATLNINNLGAKPIYYKVNTTSANYYPANTVVLLVYETTTLSTGCFKMVYAYDSNTNNATAQNISTSSNTFPVLIGYTANATADIGNKATYFCKDVKIQPSTGILSANGFIGDVTGDVTGNASTASAVAWSGVIDKPSTFTPSSHNQASDTINAMTGYSKSSSSSAITINDSLNDAIGKLEFKVDSVDDSNYVHLTGDETIAGTKTFSSIISGDISGSSTKATQDSAGQQINTTYIKALSVSGKVITYTKGDGTTGTITTQDTNTTYSAATQSAAGLMSADDKKKLDGINTGAGKYTLKATWTKPGNGQKTVTGCTVGKPVFFVHKGYSTNYGLWCFITDVSGTISSRSTNYHHYFLGQGLSDKIGGGPKTFTVIATATSIVVDVQNAGDDDVIYVYA